MNDKYLKKILNSIYTNGYELNDNDKVIKDLYDFYNEKLPEVKYEKYYHVYVYFENDKLKIKKDVSQHMFLPNEEITDYSYKTYSKNKISKEKINNMIDTLYKVSLDRIDDLNNTLIRSKEKHKKIFKQKIRKEKINNIVK